jgi:hypothetical protein
VTYDILAQRGGSKLYSHLGALYEWSRESEGAPTQGMREVYAEQARALQERAREWDALRGGELARYNEQAKKLEAPIVVVPTGVRKEKSEKEMD